MELRELFGAMRRFDDFLGKAIDDLGGPTRAVPEAAAETRTEPSELTVSDLDAIPLRRASPSRGRLHRIEIERHSETPAEAAE